MCDDIARTSGKLGTLTDREREVARLIADGKSTKQVAAKLSVSGKTIETHRANVFAKLKVHSVAELVRYALRVGLSSILEKRLWFCPRESSTMDRVICRDREKGLGDLLEDVVV